MIRKKLGPACARRVVVCMIIGIAGFPGIARAGIGAGQTCAHGPTSDVSDHQNVTMCINSQNGEVYGGGFAQFTNEVLFEDSYEATNGGHMNAEMWLYTQTSEGRAWVELGLRGGIYHPLDSTSCHCQAYARFWAEIGPGYGEVAHLIAYTNPDHTNHSYEIQRSSTNTQYWNVYVDFNLKGTAIRQQSDRAYEIAVGIESTNVSTAHSYSGKFDFRTLEYRQLTTSVWPKWAYQRNYNGYKCTANNPPPCLWGYVVSNSEFRAMKVKYGTAVPTS
jgi:hypothetical protein